MGEQLHPIHIKGCGFLFKALSQLVKEAHGELHTGLNGNYELFNILTLAWFGKISVAILMTSHVHNFYTEPVLAC